MECEKCGNDSSESGAKFCSKCGTPYSPKSSLPYIGTPKSQGIYSITFSAIEGEFYDREEAIAAAENAECDGKPFKNYSVQLVSSAVPPETHPFVCDSCKEMVAETVEGKCENCDAVTWIKRT